MLKLWLVQMAHSPWQSSFLALFSFCVAFPFWFLPASFWSIAGFSCQPALVEFRQRRWSWGILPGLTWEQQRDEGHQYQGVARSDFYVCLQGCFWFLWVFKFYGCFFSPCIHPPATKCPGLNPKLYCLDCDSLVWKHFGWSPVSAHLPPQKLQVGDGLVSNCTFIFFSGTCKQDFLVQQFA